MHDGWLMNDVCMMRAHAMRECPAFVTKVTAGNLFVAEMQTSNMSLTVARNINMLLHATKSPIQAVA